MRVPGRGDERKDCGAAAGEVDEGEGGAAGSTWEVERPTLVHPIKERGARVRLPDGDVRKMRMS